ncbi:MAG: AtpZ/AtpI family protein [Hyphomicrobiaceae bacterium]
MSERDTGSGKREETAALKRRLSRLGEMLAAKRPPARTDADGLAGRGMSYGMRMASELVAAVLVGSFIGYALDRWLQTTPWLFLVFFLLGFIAGIVNMLRTYARMQEEIVAKTGGRVGRSVPDEDV